MTCEVTTIDSNVSGLSFAEEECRGQLPGVNGADAVWFGLEPNSYPDFGSDITRKARRPINALRKNQKGSVTGQTADAGLTQDLTQSNSLRLEQTFFFADARQKPSTAPLNGFAVDLTSTDAGDDSYNAASGLNRFLVGHLVKPNGFAQSDNNALAAVVTAVAGKITVSTALVTEANPPAVARLDAVGFRFAASAVALTVSAALATLTIAGLAAAIGTYTTAAQPAADDTVTVGGVAYTFKTALSVGPTVANEVLRGADEATALANLALAINGGAGVGVNYSMGTVANPMVSATSGAHTVVVTARLKGTAGNAIVSTETGAGAWGAGTLAGGTGAAGWLSLGLIAGEWIGIGGDTVGSRYSAGGNAAGYGRIHTITDDVITLNDTTWTPAAETGVGKTLEVYFGTVLRDEDVRTLIKKRYVQFERTLGDDAAGTQAEYVKGCIGNEMTITVPNEDFLSVEMSFVGTSGETRTGLEGLKIGARVAAPGESAYNTSSDLYRMRLNVLDPTTLNPSPLFGYASEATMKISNGVSPVKALGSAVAIDTTAGNFTGSGSATCFFSEVSAVNAVRNNADVAFSMIFAKSNGGMIFDQPLVGLGGSRAKIEVDKSITLPITMEAAESVYGHQLLHVTFPYLPTVLMPLAA
jgi:hypothetical protein